MKSNLLKLFFIVILAGFSLLLSFDGASAQSDQFRDTENCMLCHRYPAFGKFGEAGEMRIYYIYGEGYASSVHGKRECSECHKGLDKIPHGKVEKVDCSMKCHLQDRSSKKVVSHAEVFEKYKTSVHGLGPKLNPKPFPEDLPGCTYCHDNRDSYLGGDKSNEEEKGTRGHKRSQKDVINLCASCHGDEEKMARHGVESIKTFKDTFHWQAIKFGVKNAPDCISCHVPSGYSAHAIHPGTDILSPVYVENRLKTCSVGGGVQTCHPDATHAFAEGRVHEYGTKAQLLSGEEVNVDGMFMSLMAEQASADIPEEDIFHYKVLALISLLYKILIGVSIGFMSLHQLLDYRRARKKGRIFKEDKVTKTENNADIETKVSADKIRFVRLNYNEKLQHLILVVCFIVLAVTGFMLNIPEDALVFLGTAGEMVFFWRSVLHRLAGTVMILVSLYHVYYILFNTAGRRWIKDIMLRPSDLKEMVGSLGYYVGLKDSPPEYDRFCYKHKFEYFALFLGNIIMSATGLLIWTEQYWSKFMLDISSLVHSMEAILASLAIIIWHLYEVQLSPNKFPGDSMWLHGLMDEEEMKKEYPLHYKKIMADPELQKIYIKRGDDIE